MTQHLRSRKTVADLEREGCVIGIQDGNHGAKHPTSKDYVSEGVPFLMAGNISDGRVDTVNCKFIPRSLGDSLRIGFARPGDVLLTHKGSIGNVGIVPNGFDYVMLTPQVTYYRVDQNKIDIRFLAYAFRDPLFRAEMDLVSAQSTRPFISISEQRHLAIYYHPLPTQHKIAGILSAYDDLIENNTRRIAILEEMAQTIYREWFVNFRFPGHENVKLVDSPLGQIPEGWEVVRFSDECRIVNGFAFKSKDYADEGTLIVRTKDFSSTKYININDPIRLPDQLLDKHSKYSLEEHDFLLIMVGASIGRFGIVFRKDLPALQNQNMWAIRPTSDSCFSRYYIIQAMSDLIDRVTNFATGAARDFYRKGFFYDQQILRPSEQVLASFDAVISPTIDLIGNILQKNENLRTTRDLLLPKLISGKLDVENLDIDIGEPIETLEEATA